MIDRTKRVKDARSEAQKEIEDYRKQKDEEFKKFESEVRAPLPAFTHLSPGNRRRQRPRRYRMKDGRLTVLVTQTAFERQQAGRGGGGQGDGSATGRDQGDWRQVWGKGGGGPAQCRV